MNKEEIIGQLKEYYNSKIKEADKSFIEKIHEFNRNGLKYCSNGIFCINETLTIDQLIDKNHVPKLYLENGKEEKYPKKTEREFRNESKAYFNQKMKDEIKKIKAQVGWSPEKTKFYTDAMLFYHSSNIFWENMKEEYKESLKEIEEYFKAKEKIEKYNPSFDEEKIIKINAKLNSLISQKNDLEEIIGKNNLTMKNFEENLDDNFYANIKKLFGEEYDANKNIIKDLFNFWYYNLKISKETAKMVKTYAKFRSEQLIELYESDRRASKRILEEVDYYKNALFSASLEKNQLLNEIDNFKKEKEECQFKVDQYYAQKSKIEKIVQLLKSKIKLAH